MLRPYDGLVVTVDAFSLQDVASYAYYLNIRMRYNPDIRLVTLRLPGGTKREQVLAAFECLTEDERMAAYRLPQHRLGNR